MTPDESFLHYCWRHSHLRHLKLTTTDGEDVCIVAPGYRNTNSGPDILDARVQVGSQLWVGAVEFHVQSSQWDAHGHTGDPAYNNVILHVVWEHDRCPSSQTMPHLALQGKGFESFLEAYDRMQSSLDHLPCTVLGTPKSPLDVPGWLTRVSVERLESRFLQLQEDLARHNNHWPSLFYSRISRYYGVPINKEPFEQLSWNLPLNRLAATNDPIEAEALAYGMAGLLPTIPTDDYTHSLVQVFAFARTKWALEPMPPGQWKWMRTRPANFPTRRISQWVALWQNNPKWIALLLDSQRLEDVLHLFRSDASPYWINHYRFGVPVAEEVPTRAGLDFARQLVLNAVIPLLFFYGRTLKREVWSDRALEWLAALPAEENAVTRLFHAIGIHPGDALESQALLSLRENYCAKRNCLNCGFGIQMLDRK
jgi:hypothetical protein